MKETRTEQAAQLRAEYCDLEMKVMKALREKVERSEKMSKHYNVNCIPVHSVDNYIELILLDNSLLFVDENGYQFTAFITDIQLLIDLL